MEANASGIAESSASIEALLFDLCDQRFAIPLRFVIEISRACAVRPVPGVPKGVLGLLSLRGRVVPVLDLRERLGFSSIPLRLEDCFVFIGIAERVLALRVDAAIGIERLATAVEAPPLPNLPDALRGAAGVARVAFGVVLICDPERFLNDAEHAALDAALTGAEGAP